MHRSIMRITPLGGDIFLVEPVGIIDPGFGNRPPVDPGYGRPGGGRPDNSLPGGGWNPVDPGWGGGWGGGGRPDQGLPIPPVKPETPIVLPPGVWPPQLPPSVDNSLPPGQAGQPGHPIVIPPDPSIGIEHPIVLPSLPEGVAILIALPKAQPKEGAPVDAAPAILVQSGKKPVLVYVSAAATPK